MPDKPLPRVPTPKSNTAADGVRAIAEGIIGQVPGAGAVVRIAQHFVPNDKARALKQWQENVTDAVNSTAEQVEAHSRMLSPREERIEGLAAELAIHIAKSSPDGMEHFCEFDKLVKEISGSPNTKSLRDAAYELQSYGLVSMMEVIGPAPGFKVRAALFEAIDRQIMGWDTRADAAQLAGRILDDEEMQSISNLHTAIGWSARRFNPAVTYLLRFFSDGHIGREIQPHYPTTWVIADGEERHVLRRFIKEVEITAAQSQSTE